MVSLCFFILQHVVLSLSNVMKKQFFFAISKMYHIIKILKFSTKLKCTLHCIIIYFEKSDISKNRKSINEKLYEKTLFTLSNPSKMPHLYLIWDFQIKTRISIFRCQMKIFQLLFVCYSIIWIINVCADYYKNVQYADYLVFQ